MPQFHDLLWALIGSVGATSKYFHEVATGNRKFILREFLLLISSGGFAAWLIAKTAYVAFSISIDTGFIISGISGVIGFGATVNVLDKFFNNFFNKP